MMLRWQIVAMPFIGGAIGWLTNMLAIKMMFRPRRPVKLPLLPITFQGLLPKCKAELALNIGRAIEEELLPVEVLIEQLDNGGYRHELVQMVGNHVDQRLHQSLPRLLPETLKNTLGQYVKEIVSLELPPLFDKLMGQVKTKLETDFRVGPLIEERIMAFDLDQLEELVISVSHRELRHLEFLGGVLGFAIGIAQAALVLSLSL
jgi:uncharacterized membrane protein YheB (UPF0754 family)